MSSDRKSRSLSIMRVRPYTVTEAIYKVLLTAGERKYKLVLRFFTILMIVRQVSERAKNCVAYTFCDAALPINQVCSSLANWSSYIDIPLAIRRGVWPLKGKKSLKRKRDLGYLIRFYSLSFV